MTAYTQGRTEPEVQAEMNLVLEDIFENGNFAGLVPGVDGAVFRSTIPPTQSPTPATFSYDLGTTEPTPHPQALLEPTPEEVFASVPPTELQSKAPVDETSNDVLDWWRWLLVAIIIVAMFAAIFLVWSRRPGKPKGRHETLQQDDDYQEDMSRDFYR